MLANSLFLTDMTLTSKQNLEEINLLKPVTSSHTLNILQHAIQQKAKSHAHPTWMENTAQMTRSPVVSRQSQGPQLHQQYQQANQPGTARTRRWSARRRPWCRWYMVSLLEPPTRWTWWGSCRRPYWRTTPSQLTESKTIRQTRARARWSDCCNYFHVEENLVAVSQRSQIILVNTRHI